MAAPTSTTTAAVRSTAQNDDDSVIFTYGTLKRGFPNHHLLQDLISTNDAEFISACATVQPYPLLIGPNGIPYLINVPGQGKRVKGELYRVSARGMVRVDELEGTKIGHYDRLPIRVDCGGDESSEAEAYFADCGFGERMWAKVGEGINEYGEKDGERYVRKDDRPAGSTFLGEIELFLR
ncbi:Putative gamma-glutamylcyclotransferase At3g02910 [Linum perenne]